MNLMAPKSSPRTTTQKRPRFKSASLLYYTLICGRFSFHGNGRLVLQFELSHYISFTIKSNTISEASAGYEVEQIYASGGESNRTDDNRKNTKIDSAFPPLPERNNVSVEISIEFIVFPDRVAGDGITMQTARYLKSGKNIADKLKLLVGDKSLLKYGSSI